MRFRRKSASLGVKIEDIGTYQIYSLIARKPGNGHGGELLRAVVAFLPRRPICLHVDPFGHQAMTADDLAAFYGRVGFVADPRPENSGWMWIYP